MFGWSRLAAASASARNRAHVGSARPAARPGSSSGRPTRLRLHLPGLVDDAHAAAGDLLQQLVVAEVAARGRPGAVTPRAAVSAAWRGPAPRRAATPRCRGSGPAAPPGRGGGPAARRAAGVAPAAGLQVGRDHLLHPPVRNCSRPPPLQEVRCPMTARLPPRPHMTKRHPRWKGAPLPGKNVVGRVLGDRYGATCEKASILSPVSRSWHPLMCFRPPLLRTWLRQLDSGGALARSHSSGAEVWSYTPPDRSPPAPQIRQGGPRSPSDAPCGPPG